MTTIVPAGQPKWLAVWGEKIAYALDAWPHEVKSYKADLRRQGFKVGGHAFQDYEQALAFAEKKILPPKQPSFAEMRRRAHERELRAFQLRQTGMTYRAIGQQFGVSAAMGRVLVFRGERRAIAIAAAPASWVEQLSKAELFDLTDRLRKKPPGGRG